MIYLVATLLFGIVILTAVGKLLAELMPTRKKKTARWIKERNEPENVKKRIYAEQALKMSEYIKKHPHNSTLNSKIFSEEYADENIDQFVKRFGYKLISDAFLSVTGNYLESGGRTQPHLDRDIFRSFIDRVLGDYQSRIRSGELYFGEISTNDWGNLTLIKEGGLDRMKIDDYLIINGVDLDEFCNANGISKEELFPPHDTGLFDGIMWHDGKQAITVGEVRTRFGIELMSF